MTTRKRFCADEKKAANSFFCCGERKNAGNLGTYLSRLKKKRRALHAYVRGAPKFEFVC